MKYSAHELANIAKMVFPGDKGNQQIMLAIAMAESKGDSDAIGMKASAEGTYSNQDLGVWQISTRYHAKKLAAMASKGYCWSDPVINAQLARQVYDEFVGAGKIGWSAWTTYNSGSYEKYLPLAGQALANPIEPTGSVELNALVLVHRFVSRNDTNVAEIQKNIGAVDKAVGEVQTVLTSVRFDIANLAAKVYSIFK